ncbi:MAG: hypothetical protein ABIQ56_05415 [Chitinophagaceae bacterium]
MKKILIGSFIGAILTFGWQTISWTVLPFHDQGFLQVADQENVIGQFSAIFKEDGQYLVPRADANLSEEAKQSYMKSRTDKPWALVSFHKSMSDDMMSSIIRGFLICLVCVWLVCLVVHRQANKTFTSIFLTVLSFGIVSFLYINYNNHN